MNIFNNYNFKYSREFMSTLVVLYYKCSEAKLTKPYK